MKMKTEIKMCIFHLGLALVCMISGLMGSSIGLIAGVANIMFAIANLANA